MKIKKDHRNDDVNTVVDDNNLDCDDYDDDKEGIILCY